MHTDYDPALAKGIVDQATDAIIFADRDGLVRVWNAGAERIFGHKAEDVIGGTLDIIIPERMVDAHNKGFNHALATGQMKYVNKVLTTRSMHKDGSRIYIDMSFDMVRDANGTILGALAIARDVTERQANDAATRVKMAELEKALAEKADKAE
ncbi:MAG: PAS domain S-box protein [Oxalicibacterium faecigallinarum]|uniref:PAS domain-containing protein n=1 Tax=Oxalicibacterium faecigallinarum TaxID=573741 RepID=UPI002808AD50|nr:PAS domain S-box protein [Oxalicibacterium faecigallinarum]MDQ7968334.1 PAS domain S-box protein [Oxalicibacterium faecigallinarum]